VRGRGLVSDDDDDDDGSSSGGFLMRERGLARGGGARGE
jgi:hypothetical protein